MYVLQLSLWLIRYLIPENMDYNRHPPPGGGGGPANPGGGGGAPRRGGGGEDRQYTGRENLAQFPTTES
jgi:hypothetical protein